MIQILKTYHLINRQRISRLFTSRRFVWYILPVFEGFGIPVLEALYSRIPVITSNVSCLPEAGPRRFICKPYDAEQMAAAMQQATMLDDRRAVMIEKGWQHAQLFTPQKCAEAVMQVYENIMPHDWFYQWYWTMLKGTAWQVVSFYTLLTPFGVWDVMQPTMRRGKDHRVKAAPCSQELVVLAATERMCCNTQPRPTWQYLITCSRLPNQLPLFMSMRLAGRNVLADNCSVLYVFAGWICRHLIKRFRKPIVSTSANIAASLRRVFLGD